MHRPMLQPSRAAAARMLCAVSVFVAAAALWPARTVAAPNAETPLASALTDTVRLAVVPTPMIADAGDTVLVEYTVPVAGPAFNAYDAYLSYDPAVLQFLPAENVTTQEGPLMTAACGLRFHVFQADTLAGRLRTSHSLMCAGRSVTGPGVLYRVRFRCRDTDADTPLTLLVTSPHKTEFYFAGTIVSPLATTGAVVRVGAGSPSAVPVPRVGVSGLRVAPNPFNPRTQIAFEAEQAGQVTVDVHAVDGRRVRTLWQGDVAAGTWRHDWDGCDDRGRPVAAGVYLVRLRTGAEVLTTRATLVR